MLKGARYRPSEHLTFVLPRDLPTTPTSSHAYSHAPKSACGRASHPSLVPKTSQEQPFSLIFPRLVSRIYTIPVPFLFPPAPRALKAGKQGRMTHIQALCCGTGWFRDDGSPISSALLLLEFPTSASFAIHPSRPRAPKGKTREESPSVIPKEQSPMGTNRSMIEGIRSFHRPAVPRPKNADLQHPDTRRQYTRSAASVLSLRPTTFGLIEEIPEKRVRQGSRKRAPQQ